MIKFTSNTFMTLIFTLAAMSFSNSAFALTQFLACGPAPEVPGGLIPFLAAAVTGGLVLWRNRNNRN